MDGLKKGKVEVEKEQLFNSSCSRCRSRKQKCDGVQPTCSRCKDAGSICEYTARRPSGRASELYGRKKKRHHLDEDRGNEDTRAVVSKGKQGSSIRVAHSTFQKDVLSYFMNASMQEQLYTAQFNNDGMTLSLSALSLTYLQLYPDSRFTTSAASRCWDELGISSERFCDGWLIQPNQLGSIDVYSHFRLLALVIQYGCAFTLGLTVVKMRVQAMDIFDKTMQLIVYSTDFLTLVPPEEAESLVRHIVFLLHVVGIVNDRKRGLRVIELAEKAMALANYTGPLSASFRAFRNWVYPELVTVETLEDIIGRLDLTVARPTTGSSGGESYGSDTSLQRIEHMEDFRSKAMELGFTYYCFQPPPMSLQSFLEPLVEIPLPHASRSVMYRIAFDLCFYHYERMLKRAKTQSQRDSLAAMRNPVAAIVALSLYHQNRYDECFRVISSVFEALKAMTSPFLGQTVPLALCAKVLYHMGKYSLLIRILEWVCAPLQGGITPDRDGMVRAVFMKVIELPIIKQASASLKSGYPLEITSLRDEYGVVPSYPATSIPPFLQSVQVCESVSTVEGAGIDVCISKSTENGGRCGSDGVIKLSSDGIPLNAIQGRHENEDQYDIASQANVEIASPTSILRGVNEPAVYPTDFCGTNEFIPEQNASINASGGLDPSNLTILQSSMNDAYARSYRNFSNAGP